MTLFIVLLGVNTSYFSKGVGPFLMHNVTCAGFESSLLECKHNLRASQLHGRAAGVHCLRGEYFKCELLCTAAITQYGGTMYIGFVIH